MGKVNIYKCNLISNNYEKLHYSVDTSIIIFNEITYYNNTFNQEINGTSTNTYPFIYTINSKLDCAFSHMFSLKLKQLFQNLLSIVHIILIV